MNKFKLITDAIISEPELIVEQKNANIPAVHKVRAPYLAADVVNENNRSYDYNTLKEAVSLYNKEMVILNSAIGELGHPQSPKINYDRACHKVIDLKEDKSSKIWIGTSQILEGTPKGDLMFGLLKNKVRIGFSSRGVGKCTDGIVDAYKLRAIDVVSDPSAPGCFVDGILESKEYMINSHGDIVEIAYDQLEENLKTLPKTQDDKTAKLQLIIETMLKSI